MESQSNSLMDELFEKIRILEEENKSLQCRKDELDFKLQSNKNLSLRKLFLPYIDDDNDPNKKLKEELQKKILASKKNIEENFDLKSEEKKILTKNSNSNITNINENDILEFLKLLWEKKKMLQTEKSQSISKVQFRTKINSENYQIAEKDFYEMKKIFNEKYKERIINHNKSFYVIKNFENFFIKGLLLYDSNGIKVDQAKHNNSKIYSRIDISELYENSYILAVFESEIVKQDYSHDDRNILKIYYQMLNNELIPYKIEPHEIDINQYNIQFDTNKINSVQNKENGVFVQFQSVLINSQNTNNVNKNNIAINNLNKKNNLGLISSSLIKVYTTLHSKDILNILHVHLNDTSEEITIDTAFIDKEEKIKDYKKFEVDIMGNKLTYKFIFKENNLVKIFYNVSQDFVDEPPFEEIRLPPNHFVQILEGDYKNYFGQVQNFPIGMLAIKKNSNSSNNKQEGLSKMKSFGYEKEGYCKDRHLEELPGFVSVKILFLPNFSEIEDKDEININIPVCYLRPLTNDEEIAFEKKIIIKEEEKKFDIQEEIEEWEKICKNYELYINDKSELEKKSLEELKNILEKLDNIKEDKYEDNIRTSSNNNLLIEKELMDKLFYIKDIKEKMQRLLISLIRYFTLIGKK